MIQRMERHRTENITKFPKWIMCFNKRPQRRNSRMKEESFRYGLITLRDEKQCRDELIKEQ